MIVPIGDERMRRICLLLLSLTAILFISCSKNDDERSKLIDMINTYTDHWQNHEFEKMYNMITEEAKETYDTEQFIDRYQKIYEDLQIENTEISFTDLSGDEIEEAYEKGNITIPISVSMDSIAGDISFDYEIDLQLFSVTNEETDEDIEEKWEIAWNPGLIFPELKDGGEITIQTIPAERGEILDRNMMPLAINDVVYDIGVIPRELEDHPEQQKEQIASVLNISKETIDEKLEADWVEPDLFVPLSKVPKSDEETLKKLREISSVRSQEVTGRVYPLGKSAAHLTGYIGKITSEELEEQEDASYSADDMIGKRGLEQLYEKQLKGENGVKILVVQENGEDTVIAEKPVKDGEDITLTIDVNIQEEIFAAYEGHAGTAAAIDPKSGETLALVSSPAFDPNEMLYSYKQDNRDELAKDPDEPLINRFSASFAPGSVIKPITAAIGLANDSIDPEEEIEIEGLTWKKDEWDDYEIRRVSDSKGPVDLADAIIHSDNIYFAMQTIDMGSDAFIEGLKQFGFEEELPFEYPFVKSTISSEGSISNEVDLANSSYGQAEIEMSALHLASAYTTFLNDGDMLKPTLLMSESEDDEDGNIWKEKLISADDATLMQDLLRKVVTDGTASQADGSSVKISGKTGTAELKQTKDDEDGKNNGWFIGYPSDDQDILIAMMMEDVEGSSDVVKTFTDVLMEIKD